PLALRPARAGLWLALRVRHRRDLHASRPCDLSLWIPVSAGAGRTAQVREHSTHCDRAPDRFLAYRRDDYHDLRVNGLLSSIQRELDLDSTARRTKCWRLPDPGALVSIDQLGFQHPVCAAAVLDLAAPGIAGSR